MQNNNNYYYISKVIKVIKDVEGFLHGWGLTQRTIDQILVAILITESNLKTLEWFLRSREVIHNCSHGRFFLSCIIPSPPDPGLCPGPRMGAPLPDPCYRLALPRSPCPLSNFWICQCTIIWFIYFTIKAEKRKKLSYTTYKTKVHRLPHWFIALISAKYLPTKAII